MNWACVLPSCSTEVWPIAETQPALIKSGTTGSKAFQESHSAAQVWPSRDAEKTLALGGEFPDLPRADVKTCGYHAVCPRAVPLSSTSRRSMGVVCNSIAHSWMCSPTFPAVRRHLLVVGLWKLSSSFSQKYVRATQIYRKLNRDLSPCCNCCHGC